jgi:hypothetical protein
MTRQRAGWPADAAGEADRQNFLLVHGAWPAAVHWNKVAEQLTAGGTAFMRSTFREAASTGRWR